MDKNEKKTMTINEFETKLEEIIKELFGNCTLRQNILRAIVEHLGVTDSCAVFEVTIEQGLHPEAPYTILHFHTTIAQKIPDDQVPYVLMAVNDLNNVISVGAFPSFGCFAYYPPLQQIYLTYRMPVYIEDGEATLDSVRYYLGSLYEVLDIFTDYILFSCDHPGEMDLDDYMAYLDTVSDLNDLNERLAVLREQVGDMENDTNTASETDSTEMLQSDDPATSIETQQEKKTEPPKKQKKSVNKKG